MAIRKSKEETFSIQGTIDDCLLRVEQALKKGNFTKVNVNKTLNQATGNYKKLTVWGEITVTLLPKSDGSVRINVSSTANVDNIFALISSPNKKILNQFKNNFQ